MINVATVSGYVAADAKFQAFESGATKAWFTVYNSENYWHNNTKKTRVTKIKVECWGKVAEVAGKHCGKGKHVVVSGSLANNSWTTQDGTKTITLIKADSIELIGTPKPVGVELPETEADE